MRDKRAELARLPQQVSKQIKETFDKAVQDGVDTLSQVGLLSAFLRPESEAQPAPTVEDRSALDRIHPPSVPHWQLNTYLSPGSVDLAATLNASGVSKPRAKTILTAINIALEAGMVVVVAGIAAPTLARKLAIARTQMQALVKTIEIGASQQQFDSIAVRDSEAAETRSV